MIFINLSLQKNKFGGSLEIKGQKLFFHIKGVVGFKGLQKGNGVCKPTLFPTYFTLTVIDKFIFALL